MIAKNFFSFIAFFNKLLLVVLIFCLFSAVATAQEFNRNTVSENENKAIELGKVWNLESIKQSVTLFEQTAKHWENLNQFQKAVYCLNEAAKLAQSYSDFETSFRVLKKAIKIANTNKLFEEESISSSLYAFYSNEKNDKKTSRQFSGKALLLSEKTNSATAKAYSNFCNGMYEYYYGKMNAATAFFELSANYAQQTQDIFIISQSLFYVGFAYIREGYSYKAVEKMESALQLCEKFGYKKGEALSYFGLAASYYFTEKQKALNFLIKAESLFITDCEWMEKARIATTIGNLYMDLGEFELAESYFQKAVPNHEKANYLLGKITALTLLADTYLLKADLTKAKETYESALSLSTKTDDKFRSALITEGLGNIEFKKYKFDFAIKKYREALNQYNEIGVKMPVIENLLGKIFKLKGDHKKAREFFNSALEINRRTRDFLQLSETLFNFANLHIAENNRAEALSDIKESIELTENLYSDVANSKLKSSYFSSVFDRYELYINLLMKNHSQSPDKNYATQALQAAEKSRARSLLENLAFADFTKDADLETVKKEKETRALLNTKADKLIDLLSENAEKNETDKISLEINELENQLEEIKAKLKQNSPVYSAIKNPAPFDVGEFQRNILDENSLLLEFSFGKTESYLWLVSKTEIDSYVLPPREQIEVHIEKLRELIEAREKTPDEEIEDYQKRISEADNIYQIEARELSNKLFAQIADKIKDRRLIIVPDGKLHYFPVSALPLPNSASNIPILLTNEIVYEPSAQTLSILSKNRAQTIKPEKNLLVFSDPIFTDDDPRFSIEPSNFDNSNKQTVSVDKFRFVESLKLLERLPASKSESDSITEIIGASKTDNFSGFDANREQLLNLKTDNYKIIHFATHGTTDESRPELSGIILSRFDEKGQNRDESVRIHDIYGLNLNADLVVLSACETGVGKEVKGEGLLSLNNAFLQAGARSVMASLWKVEDTATLDLMKNFYDSLKNKNLPPSQALREAQIKMWNNPQYKSPFYWAAFTIQGEFKETPNLSDDYRYFIFPAIILLISGLIGAYFWRRKRI